MRSVRKADDQTMMKVYLDGQPVSEAGQTLASALDAVRSSSRGRLVIEAQADGAPIPDAHLASPPESAPYAEELRFISADAVALVRESLLEAADLLPPAREQHQRLADLIASGEPESAIQQLGTLLAVWQQVMDTLQAVRSCEAVTLPAQEIDATATGLNDRLIELRTCIERQDWSGLSDLLAYDLTEEAQRWEQLLATLARAVEHAHS